MLHGAIDRLLAGEPLSEDEAAACMRAIMDGAVPPVVLAAFLTALRIKGTTVDEIVGLARVMRDRAMPVTVEMAVMDTCGTGGDGQGTFNVSTAAAIVVAAAGQPVAKHGNRAASSQCGSADVLEALGVPISLTPEQAVQVLNEAGFGFLFAPAFHPAMKHAGPVRRELGFRTVFNILGPLTNPARAATQMLGVATADIQELMAAALARLGVERALVVHGRDGLDEVSLSAPTVMIEVRSGEILPPYIVTPEQFGFARRPLSEVAGGDAIRNARIVRDVLHGQSGAYRDMTLLNAGAALYICDRAESIANGVDLARALIDDGTAEATLDAIIETTVRVVG